ncbi:MAG: MBL fold metallo-hydrolase [Spirochaetes bacterium]|nr:MBL fold metallo-hydrolase [Spirochaetota bacterium]
MKKPVKRLLAVAGVLVTAVVISMGLYVFKFMSELKKMSPLPTKLITDGIYSVNDKFVNLYIVRQGNASIAIDGANDLENVKNEMSQAGLDPEAVQAVFLTHTDEDHVAALPLFANAVVYISKAEEQMIDGKTRRALLFHNKAIPSYKTLEDGETIDVGGIQVKCITTPGHTPGAACYIVDGKYLFTGDTLSLKEGRVALFNEFFNMDSEAEQQSWEKIMDLPGVQYLLTAHYGLTDDYRRAFEKIRK